ncbi:MAG: TonB-dependent receptor plug domain-containing protein [Bacteroidales bacterium]|jgi:iron complex outermembrane receptor protein|nr:TonB-dependent receptor plug domain-containing protein [Bacteroidales bacterium]
MLRFFCILAGLLLYGVSLFGQQKPVEALTVEDIMSMSFDDLSAYSMEDQLRMAGMAGVSFDDLFKLLLNRDVSIASKHDESYFDTPFSTSSLTAEELENAGVLSVPEALRLLPGVIVREKTNGNYDIQIRNSNNIAGQQSLFSENTMTLVMLDGRIIYTHTTGGMFWETLPIGISDVEKIEVIRGAASAMYGANAVTGVINIITKKSSPEKVSIEADIKSGGYFNGPNLFNGKLSGTQYLSILYNANEKWKFRISGNYSHRERTQDGIYFYTTDRLSFEGPTDKYLPVDSAVMHGSDPKAMFGNPSQSLFAYGINGLLAYTGGDNFNLNVTAGIQQSEAIASNLDLYFFAHSERDYGMKYVNLQSNIYGLSLQADYSWGYGDLACGIPGLKADQGSFNVNVEYRRRWGGLALTPGFYYSINTLNSAPYKAANQSYFEGRQKLSSWAPSFRIDYSPVRQLRLIGGLRLEKNNIPDRYYLTWQLAATGKINEGSLLRAVYSRANRSPFMMDTRTNSGVTIHSPRQDVNIIIAGADDLRMAYSDMLEAGYRQKIGKHILLNVEIFHSIMKDLNTAGLEELKFVVDINKTTLDNLPLPSYLRYRFANLPEVQKQTGLTVETGIVLNERINFRFWGTVQQTRLIHHMDNEHIYFTRDNDIHAVNKYVPTMMGMGIKLGNEYSAGYRTAIGEGKSEEDARIAGVAKIFKYIRDYPSFNTFTILDSDLEEDGDIAYVNIKSKQTPAFYGGCEINWRFAEKFLLFVSGYGFSQHSYSNQFLTTNISGKFLLNAKIAYTVTDNASIAFSVNNILHSTSQEFGFMDPVGTQGYATFNFKF